MQQGYVDAAARRNFEAYQSNLEAARFQQSLANERATRDRIAAESRAVTTGQNQMYTLASGGTATVYASRNISNYSGTSIAPNTNIPESNMDCCSDINCCCGHQSTDKKIEKLRTWRGCSLGLGVVFGLTLGITGVAVLSTDSGFNNFDTSSVGGKLLIAGASLLGYGLLVGVCTTIAIRCLKIPTQSNGP